MTRHAAVVKLRPAKEAEYRELHDTVWPVVLERLRLSNIRNYSIFLHDGVLFSYFEYVGGDYEADMAAIAADPGTQRWWELTEPCQEPFGCGEWWTPIEELFHAD